MITQTFHEIIQANVDRIVEVFVKAVREHNLPPRQVDQNEVMDDLHRYLRQVAVYFEQGHHEKADGAAKVHGGQRWYLGYDLRSVILEYGVLRSALTAVVAQTGYQITNQEFENAAHVFNVGVAEAAVEFTERSTQEINDALAAAQAAVRAREDIVAVVSHDLKNPLNVIYGTTTMLNEMLENESLGALKAPLQKMSGRIERASHRMNRLITDLLDLGKIQAGGVEINVREERTSDLLEEAWQQSSALAEQHSIRLVKDEAGQAIVICDRERVMQVFDNVVGNAIKFSPEGGVVTLRVECTNIECTFSVRDEGPGIPTEQLPLLFDRFWKAPRSTATTGTGLGLAIAKGIVDAHRGRIWVESVVGQGTSFFFTLPGRGQ